MKNTKIKFKGKRIDNGDWVYGYYFISPLTSENFYVENDNSFASGKQRHCISTETGVTYEVIEDTVSCNMPEIKEIAEIAWKAAANAYRMYPENKHTFSSYWDSSKNIFLALVNEPI